MNLFRSTSQNGWKSIQGQNSFRQKSYFSVQVHNVSDISASINRYKDLQTTLLNVCDMSFVMSVRRNMLATFGHTSDIVLGDLSVQGAGVGTNLFSAEVSSVSDISAEMTVRRVMEAQVESLSGVEAQALQVRRRMFVSIQTESDIQGLFVLIGDRPPADLLNIRTDLSVAFPAGLLRSSSNKNKEPARLRRTKAT